MGCMQFWTFCVFAIVSIYGQEDANRNAKFSIFQIIKFKNEACVGGSSRNGTCYTAAECDSVGGEDAGSCADGFGVCCTVTLSEGATTSLNQSYIVQEASSTLAAGSMMYTICPCSEDVCRIRFDFTAFSIAGPVTGPALSNAGGTTDFSGDAIGDCLVDTFSVSSSQGGSPVICGDNKGQHMIIDTDGSGCSKVNFGIGGGTSSRSWDIMVTQYKCGDENGGPTGCLQWFTSAAGKIRSFNFPEQSSTTKVADSVVHLSNQHYSACIRRPASTNRICYEPCRNTGAGNSIGDQTSFGVSPTPQATYGTPGEAAAQGGVAGTNCLNDYIEIIGGTSETIATIGTTGTTASINNRFCGRYLGTATKATSTTKVCTASQPFRLGVEFDDNELTTGTASMADIVENFAFPSGILGFALCYTTA